ncbi:hypothetical protein PRIPAC_81980 [Pristionchus pacificus]|uniref:Uncharacterized protein n=1 Tax=Pristionchus pacificus TaxID=54126 RepID=A0A2A6CLG8_PRIPA|nr:hypothetical protein PRIPAC_81980 [Pristionchus pacificus]|eukprot:PDM79085.1 hypothetical protein PRIPAC_31664 [Pristionchus pacificus]
MTLLLLTVFVHILYASNIYTGNEDRLGRVISVYDRNCFFSPIGCHLLLGRRVMPFITPSEVEEENFEEREKPDRIMFKKQPTNAIISPEHFLTTVHGYFGR